MTKPRLSQSEIALSVDSILQGVAGTEVVEKTKNTGYLGTPFAVFIVRIQELLHFGSSIQGGEPMLVLSRKVGEEILIGDNIRLVVNRLAGNRVTIGIAAPDDVHIVRGELHALVHQFDEPTPAEALSAAM